MRKKVLVIPSAAALVLSLVVSSGFALGPGESLTTSERKGDLGSLSLEQLMQVQVSTASKHPQDESETPASTTVITRDDIRTYGFRTLADVLQSIRGFWVNTDRNYSYLGVRGFARPGDYNTRVLLMVNGHRLNENVYDSALIGTEFPLDLDLVERIEVVRGPGSSLYGTDALFGVINVITKQPSITATVEASADASSLFTRKARITLGLPSVLDGAMLSATLYHSNGNQDLFFPDLNTPATNNGIAQNVDGDRFGSAIGILNWKDFQVEGLIGSRTKLIPTGSFGTVFDDGANRTRDARGYVELGYKHDYVSGMQVVSQTAYDGYLYRGGYLYFTNGVSGTTELENDSGSGAWVSNNSYMSSPIGHRNLLTAGTEFMYNLRQNQHVDYTGGQGPLFDSHYHSYNYAIYGQDELQITSRLVVNAGLRVDDYSTFGSTLNPRIAAIYHVDTRTSLKYGYGHAFRAPSVYELFYSDGATQEGNPALQPERVASQDVSVERALGPSFHLVLEAYSNSLSQMLNEQLDPVTGFYQFVNVNSSMGRGLEGELDTQIMSVRGQLSYTVQRSVDGVTSAELANSPEHMAKIEIHAPVSRSLVAALNAQYESAQKTFANLTIPYSFIANANLSTKKPIFGLDLLASCTNLTNRSNYDPPSPLLPESRIQEDGRGFRFQISHTFSTNSR